jgi:polyhydroxyalkanoate synthesis regulator phasin
MPHICTHTMLCVSAGDVLHSHHIDNLTSIFVDSFLLRSDKFMHEARVMICEMYCTINRRVDLQMLAEKLQMTEEEAEKWMVEMVRNSAAGSNTADAKIDSSAKQVRQMIDDNDDRGPYENSVRSIRWSI